MPLTTNEDGSSQVSPELQLLAGVERDRVRIVADKEIRQYASQPLLFFDLDLLLGEFGLGLCHAHFGHQPVNRQRGLGKSECLPRQQFALIVFAAKPLAVKVIR